MEHQIRFGMTSPQNYVRYQELQRLWHAADELGYDSAWLFDHFLPVAGAEEGPYLESIVTLTALAMQTARLRLGPLVLGNTYRHPAIVANMIAALDIVSGGRVELGLGAGSFERDHLAYGIPFPSTSTRIHMLEEALTVVKLLWTRSKCTFEGKCYTLNEAVCEPKPVQNPHPPIWVGGGGERLTLPIVARHADGWNFMATPQVYKHKLDVLSKHCEAAERDVTSIRKSIHFVLCIDQDGARAESKALEAYVQYGSLSEGSELWAIIGSPEKCIARLREYADLGVTDFIVAMRQPYDYEGLELFAEKVIPAFR